MTKTNGRVLKDLYKDYFRIGVACEKINGKFTNHEIGNPDKEELMAEQFNSMTFGNELKPMFNMGINSPERTEESVPFVIDERAKAMLDWAKANNMPVRGHVMVWHSQCPREVFCKGYEAVTIPTDPEKLKENPHLKFFEKLDPVCFVDRETLLKRLKSYIFSLTEYMYKNDYMRTIYAWDVVNEAIELEDKTPTGLRDSYWYKIIGDDFIYWSFRFANEAVLTMSEKYAESYGIDPSDKDAVKEIVPILFYNDYNEFQPKKKDAIIAMLNREGHGHGSILGEKLITGIGMQGHISDNNDIEEYRTALRDYSKLVDCVHITELDIKCTATGVNREYYQAVFYKAFFEMLVEEVKNGANLKCVTFWGLTDDNSWIRGADPLPFRGDLSAKPAYDALCYVFTGESLGDPEPVYIDLSDRKYDFEGEETADELGFVMKGFGRFEIKEGVAHSGKKAIANEFRHGEWSGVAVDVTDFIGQTIRFLAWVKSEALEVVLKADLGGATPVIGNVDCSSGEWVLLSCEYKVPSNAHSMQLIFGTREAAPDKFSAIYVDDVEIKLVGLCESFEDKENIAAIRGAGHLPILIVTDKESRDGKSHSLLVSRAEKDATVKLNISSYIGKKTAFCAYVKTSDKVIRAGLDGAPSVEFVSTESNGDWTEVRFEKEIPDGLLAAEIYIETDGNADMFIDDVFVTVAR